MPAATWTPCVMRYSQPGEAGRGENADVERVLGEVRDEAGGEAGEKRDAERQAEPGGDPLVVQAAGEGALAKRPGRPVGLQPLGDERDGILGPLHAGPSATSRANQRCSCSQRSATAKPAAGASPSIASTPT